MGQTFRSFEQRRNEHLQQAARGRLKRFHHALVFYGPDAFEWEIIKDDIQNLEDANRLEVEWIVKLNAHVTMGGYNLTFGGEGSSGFKHTPESRKKIGDTFRGKPKSEEQRRKMGDAISRARKGKKYGPRRFKNPEQARENLSSWQRCRPRDRGWHHSDATKVKMKKPHKCSQCGEVGHKRTTCKRNYEAAGD